MPLPVSQHGILSHQILEAVEILPSTCGLPGPTAGHRDQISAAGQLPAEGVPGFEYESPVPARPLTTGPEKTVNQAADVSGTHFNYALLREIIIAIEAVLEESYLKNNFKFENHDRNAGLQEKDKDLCFALYNITTRQRLAKAYTKPLSSNDTSDKFEIFN